jgi:hypothetical protein
MSARYYVRPRGYKAHDETGESRFVWPLDAGDSKTVRTDISWTLAPIPGAIPAVLDLVHLAAGAYMADRSTRRGQRFSREISLRVAFDAAELWTDDLLAETQDLLGWLTGDEWTLSVAPAPGIEIPDALDASRSTEPVSLLSGGLDSYPPPSGPPSSALTRGSASPTHRPRPTRASVSPRPSDERNPAAAADRCFSSVSELPSQLATTAAPSSYPRTATRASTCLCDPTEAAHSPLGPPTPKRSGASATSCPRSTSISASRTPSNG